MKVLSLTLVLVMLISLPQLAFGRFNSVEQSLLLFDCEQGDEQACLEVQLFSLYLFYTPADAQTGAALEKRIEEKQGLCDQGKVNSCTELGVLLYQRQPNDNARAYELFVNGCDGGDGWGCILQNEVTDAVRTNAGKNFEKYYSAQNALCQKKNQKSCATQGRLNVLMQDVIPDKKIWYDQLVVACEHDVSRACVNLSYLMSDDGRDEYQKFELGSSVLDRFTRRSAVSYAKKACRLGNPTGCWNASLFYFDGEGVRVNERLGKKYLVEACQKGMPEACDEMNYEVYWREGDPDDELNEACDTGDFNACLILDYQDYRNKLGKVTDSDKKKLELEFISKTEALCKRGSGVACANTAVVARRIGDWVKAERFATPACEQDIAMGCLVLGNVWKLDKETPDHYERSIPFLQKACDLDGKVGCNNLGDSYRKGLGVEKNVARAKRYLTIACNKKVAIACENLQLMTKQAEPIKSETP